jgi:hypothetical protein
LEEYISGTRKQEKNTNSIGCRKGKTMKTKCPVCGSVFYPTPEHVYKTSEKGRLVCRYNCMMKYRNRKTESKKEVTNENNT